MDELYFFVISLEKQYPKIILVKKIRMIHLLSEIKIIKFFIIMKANCQNSSIKTHNCLTIRHRLV
jgi:hypothetical protein